MSFSSMDVYYGASTRRRTYLRALRAWGKFGDAVSDSTDRFADLWEPPVAPFCGLIWIGAQRANPAF